jgi:hypothetical protein
MPAINITTFDGGKLLKRLNDDEEIAFVIYDGAGRWKAVPSLGSLEPGETVLWHVPSGTLPLLLLKGRTATPERTAVPHPFAGWEDSTVKTYAGGAAVNHPNVLVMQVRLHEKLPPPMLLASFSWIGGYYSTIGMPAHPSTSRWWRRFSRWFEREAELLAVARSS